MASTARCAVFDPFCEKFIFSKKQRTAAFQHVLRIPSPFSRKCPSPAASPFAEPIRPACPAAGTQPLPVDPVRPLPEGQHQTREARGQTRNQIEEGQASQAVAGKALDRGMSLRPPARPSAGEASLPERSSARPLARSQPKGRGMVPSASSKSAGRGRHARKQPLPKRQGDKAQGSAWPAPRLPPASPGARDGFRIKGEHLPQTRRPALPLTAVWRATPAPAAGGSPALLPPV